MNEQVDEFEFFLEKDWSDGLPVVTPTEERIARMLTGTKRSPDEVIGPIPPAMEVATVESVAVHALMAGCKPEYLPVVIEATEMMLRDEFNVNGVQGTMHGVAPMMIVNGPYAEEIGIHGGNGCMGPGFRANAAIGRAIRLVLMNLGQGIPGVSSMTIFGMPSRYTYCLTENMEDHPWDSLAASKGYGPDENVITMAMVESPRFCFDDVSDEPDRLLNGVADTMVAMGSWNMHTRSDMVVAMGPQHAAICANAGMSRANVHAHLCEIAGRKVGDLKNGGNWRKERALAFPIDVDPDDDNFFIPAIKDPQDLQLIVAGGWGPCTAVCHGWSGGSRAVHGSYEV
ncbi:MAG: hypothetical protein CL696_14040 [Chloroflexi bacterium]|nr:hypothetical protein [Chloroflexota bacterium]MDP6498158.1 hypothetical protein [Dehalococcoidia bacterium]MDP7587500.1 hypothetical protein [Dehalococcoidia bacterium]MQF88639.1 hypothetical protein [SAR202 cluster bacterium]MQG55183.1 hypothetical protein [SAR202 cluster bacterium]